MFEGIRAVFFDLDGTLVDSVPDIAVAVDGVLAGFDLPPCGESQVRGWVGNGAEVLLQRALAAATGAPAPAAMLTTAKSRFKTLYGEQLCVHSRLYPGVLDGLTALRQRQLSLACITNKPTPLARRLVAQLGLDQHFAEVLGGDCVVNLKPAPDALQLCAGRLGVELGQVLMVGDSVNDVRAARNAGCAVACVPYGYNHGNDIRDARPDAVVASLAELEPLLRQAA